jgi:hypothetical protein
MVPTQSTKPSSSDYKKGVPITKLNISVTAEKNSIILKCILLLCCVSITDMSQHIPEDCDTASRQWQAQDGLGYSDWLEAELAAKTECTVAHEGHRHDRPVRNKHTDSSDTFMTDSITFHMNERLIQK